VDETRREDVELDRIELIELTAEDALADDELRIVLDRTGITQLVDERGPTIGSNA